MWYALNSYHPLLEDRKLLSMINTYNIIDHMDVTWIQHTVYAIRERVL